MPTNERTIVHGVFVKIFDKGVLLTGSSGIGKSELALALICNGHALIADDAVEFTRDENSGKVQGASASLLQDLLEVRGLGILNIRTLYGPKAIVPPQVLDLVINLQIFSETELANLDRISGANCEFSLLNQFFPELILPVAAGRNLVVLVETAVRMLQCGQLNKQDESINFTQSQNQSKITLTEVKL